MNRSNKNHPEHEQYVLQRAAWMANPDGPWSKSVYNLRSGYSVYHVVVGKEPLKLDWFGGLMLGMWLTPFWMPLVYLFFCMANR